MSSGLLPCMHREGVLITFLSLLNNMEARESRSLTQSPVRPQTKVRELWTHGWKKGYCISQGAGATLFFLGGFPLPPRFASRLCRYYYHCILGHRGGGFWSKLGAGSFRVRGVDKINVPQNDKCRFFSIPPPTYIHKSLTLSVYCT